MNLPVIKAAKLTATVACFARAGNDPNILNPANKLTANGTAGNVTS